MSVRIACPACAKPLKIAETLLGKELACPKCEARIVAPPIGSATDPDTRAYTLLCIGCSAVLTIDDQTVETPVQCATCGTPVDFADYPDLAAFREEVRAEKKAAQKAAREAERAAKEAERAARLAEQEAARKAEREKAETAEAEERRRQDRQDADRKAQERLEAKAAAAAMEVELRENAERLAHAGGCIRCGSIRLVQKMELRSDFGKVLYGLGAGSMIFGTILCVIWVGGVIVGAIGGEFTVTAVALSGFLAMGVMWLGGGTTLIVLSNQFKVREGECQQCGWRWRT